MLTAKPTENLTGVTIEGEYDDFYNLVDAIHHMTGFEESYDDMYYGVKNRLLGICYDLRHAYQGNREICMIDNGMDEYKMKWHSMITPTQNVHFSVNVYFPEAVFVALSAPELFMFSRGEYGSRRKDEEEHVYAPKFAEYLQDKAQIELLCSVILGALGEVIGDEDLEKMLRNHGSLYRMEYNNYATMYVDKCNIEYFKTPVDKRKDKIRNIAKRLVKKPAAYDNMKYGLETSARHYGCSIYQLEDPKLDYPEDIEW